MFDSGLLRAGLRPAKRGEELSMKCRSEEGAGGYGEKAGEGARGRRLSAEGLLTLSLTPRWVPSCYGCVVPSPPTRTRSLGLSCLCK